MAIDLNAIKAEYNRLESAGQSNYLDNFVPMPEGEGSVVLRLLPYGDNPLPFVATRTHKMNSKNLHCPMNLVNGKWVGNCPICNHYKSLWKQSDSASEDEAKMLQAEARAIKPVERYYWNAIVRVLTNKQGQVEKNVGPKIFSCGKQLQSKLLRAITGDEIVGLDPLGDVTDVTGAEGRDLKVIKRLVKGGNDEKYPNYNESIFLPVSVAGSDEDVEKWLESIHDLNSLRRILPNEDLAREVRIHRGLEQDPDLAYDHGANTPSVDADDEPVPTPVTPKPKTVKVTPAPAPVQQTRPSSTAQVQRPKVQAPPVVDDDEAMPDDDFLAKLKGM